MRAYSMDLRERVLADCDAGMGTLDVANKYRVSRSWVRGLKKRWRESGDVTPRPRGPNHRTKLSGHQEELAQFVRESPDATLEELRARLPVRVSVGTLWNALRALKLRFKKKSGAQPSRTGPM